MAAINPELIKAIISGKVCIATEPVTFKLEILKTDKKGVTFKYGWVLPGQFNIQVHDRTDIVTLSADDTFSVNPPCNGWTRPFVLADIFRLSGEEV